jgi:hypothetical protein
MSAERGWIGDPQPSVSTSPSAGVQCGRCQPAKEGRGFSPTRMVDAKTG